MTPEAKRRPLILITPDIAVRYRLQRSRDLWRAIALGLVLGIAIGAVVLAMRLS